RVRVGRVRERQPMAHEEAGLRYFGDDEVTELRGESDDGRLPHAQRQPLLPELAEREAELSALRVRVDPSRVVRHIQPDGADPPRWVDEADEVLDHPRGILGRRIGPVDGLVADGLDSAHDARHLLLAAMQLTAARLEDLLDGIPFAEIDWDGADL